MEGTTAYQLKNSYKVIRPDFDFENIPAGYDNSIWIIQYDHDLSAADIDLGSGGQNIPNVTLQFKGGLISNYGTITGNKTRIDSGLNQIFDTSGDFAGNWDLEKVYPQWFGAVGDGVTNDTVAFSKAIEISISTTTKKKITVPSNTYLLDSLVFGEFGDLNGVNFEGDGMNQTIFKASGVSNRFLQVNGLHNHSTLPAFFVKNFTFKNFTIDLALMPNDITSVGIYVTYSFGGRWDNIRIINPTILGYSVHLFDGVYTNYWNNCDFGSTTGRINLEGVITAPSGTITTQTFIGCSWGQMISYNVSSMIILSCIIQGDLTPKFVLSEQYGVNISGCDMEGTGLLYEFGTNVNQFTSTHNTLVGFSGTYSTGSIAAGILTDNVFPVTANGKPFIIKNVALISTAVASGNATALEINGVVDEIIEHAGAIRKTVKNASDTNSQVDIMCKNKTGATIIGVNTDDESFISNSGGGKISLQTGGLDRIGADSSDRLILGTTSGTLVGAAGAADALPATPEGYLGVMLNGVFRRIPYYL